MRVDEINTEHYQTLLDAKVETTNLLFADLNLPQADVYNSPVEQYRLRAEFRLWHQDDDSYYIMFDTNSKEKYRVDHYLPGSAIMQSLMQELREYVLPNEILRRKLFQVDFLTTLSGEALISLIYHKPLDEAWSVEAKQLKAYLSQTCPVHLIGRSRKQKVLVDQDFATETFSLEGKPYSFKQVENAFTQPNGEINKIMLQWSRDIAKTLSGDLLELYCGNGNFSLALADCFDHVVATEISRASVKSAQYNIQINKIDNVVIGQASAEDFSAAYFDGKSVKSLKEIDLTSFNFSTILVDPPRAGLDDKTVELVKKFDNIIYISCNPETLRNNISAIQDTHTVEKFAYFDQFPYTPHIESGVWLKRK